MALNTSDLDFVDIKQNLLNHLQADSNFTDYDFTGSALNTLVDALAYTAHYQGVHANLALNESFLDSAIIRKNVVSKAKELGYFPKQIRSAKSDFYLSIPAMNNDTSLIIPKDTAFYTTNDNNETVTFITVSDTILKDTGTELTPSGTLGGEILVVEGKFVNESWVKLAETDRFIIKGDNVTDEYMEVTIKPTEHSTTKSIWKLNTEIVKVDDESEVFFLSEVNDSRLEIYFGNNTIGKNIEINNHINVEYIKSNGEDGNNLANFKIVQDIDLYSYSDFVISDITPSYDGSSKEDIDSIKHLAPLDYQRQNRIVTAQDYKSAILKGYANVETINVWGGEDHVPPKFGKVFVSIKPKTGSVLSPLTKKSITAEILENYNVVGITPEILDPEYISIHIDSIVYVDKDKTTKNETQLIINVNDSIETFFDQSVFDYNDVFQYSRLINSIDNTDTSINSNVTDIRISEYFIPLDATKGTYGISYNNQIIPNETYSSTWINKANSISHIKDDGIGNLDLYVNDTLFAKNIGTIDYELGDINIIGWDAETKSLNEKIHIYSKPVSNNVNVSLNKLIILGDTNITISE